MNGPIDTMDALDALQQILGQPLPPGLASLGAEQAAVLVTAIETIRVQQSSALAAATDSGMAFIPRLLRGPVKKVLFG